MSEKRKSPRSRRRENIYIEITVQDEDLQPVKKVVGCESVDVSRNGLKLYVQEKIERGTILDLYVSFKEHTSKYYLTAEVRWSRPLIDEGWHYIGFEIYEAEQTDFEKWYQWIDANTAA